VRLKASNRSATLLAPEGASRLPHAVGIGREQAAQARADDDGMAVANDRVRSFVADVAGAMLDELGPLPEHRRDAASSARGNGPFPRQDGERGGLGGTALQQLASSQIRSPKQLRGRSRTRVYRGRSP